MTDPDFRKPYEDLRIGAPGGSRHGLAVFMRSGVAAMLGVNEVSPPTARA